MIALLNCLLLFLFVVWIIVDAITFLKIEQLEEEANPFIRYLAEHLGLKGACAISLSVQLASVLLLLTLNITYASAPPILYSLLIILLALNLIAPLLLFIHW